VVLILLHWKRGQSVAKKLNTVVSRLNAPSVYFKIGTVDPAFLTLQAEVFYLAPLFFRGLFTAVFTVVVFFHREKNLCHDTIPFPVEHALLLLQKRLT